MNTYWVYILASKPYGTLYIGVTNNLIGRIEAHRAGTGSKFTSRYRVHTLVYYEPFRDIEAAIQHEKSDEALDPCLEDQSHRARQPALGRSLSCAARAVGQSP